ncbi:hypothetical protein [Streptomyces sp. NPDC058613]|uniref:hypothetical protein n=1 Tax=unclassified Streptomyces TaxID=2593676 RepID=UPI00364923BE
MRLRAVRTVNGDPTFEDGAVVPSGQWQPLSEAAAQALTAPPWTPPSTLVEIVRPPALTGENLEDLAGRWASKRPSTWVKPSPSPT